jgi:hypothetical protein
MNATTEASPTSVPSSKKRRRISEENSRGQMVNQSERQRMSIITPILVAAIALDTI